MYNSGIQSPKGVWWKPAHRAETIWVKISFVWCMILFAMMPLWHFAGGQNPAGIRHKVDPKKFEARTEEFIKAYQVQPANQSKHPHPEGQAIFNQKCTACHAIGQEKPTGPDLKGVTERREKAWLVKWLQDPMGMGQNDPIGQELLAKWKFPMPPQGLNEAEIGQVLDYLAWENKNSAPEGQAQASTASIPVVKPPPGSHIYLLAKQYQWRPVLELEKDVEYTLHLSALDVNHGFSLYPMNLNFQVVPGYDYGLKVKANEAGDYRIICNEFCGIGHHTMVGRVIVTEGSGKASAEGGQ